MTNAFLTAMEQGKCFSGISERDRTLTRRVESRVQVDENGKNGQMCGAGSWYFETECSA